MFGNAPVEQMHYDGNNLLSTMGQLTGLSPSPHAPGISTVGHRTAAAPTVVDAYEGTSVIQDTIRQLALAGGVTWPFREVFTTEVRENPNFTEKVYIAEPQFMAPVAPKSAGNVLTQRIEEVTVTMSERFIGFRMSSGFRLTQAGSRSLAMFLRSFQISAQDTFAYEVYASWFAARDQTQRKLDEVLSLSYEDKRRQLALDFWLLGAINKRPRALEGINTIVNQYARECGGELNTWIITKAAAAFIDWGRPENSTYKESGPLATERLRGTNLISGNVAPKRIGEDNLYIVETFRSEGFSAKSPFQRERETGSWNIITTIDDPMSPYFSSNQTRQVANWDVDEWSEISLRTAVDNLPWGNDGRLPVPSTRERAEECFWVYEAGNRPVHIDFIGDIHPDYFTPEFIRRLVSKSEVATINRFVATKAVRNAGAVLVLDDYDGVLVQGRIDKVRKEVQAALEEAAEHVPDVHAQVRGVFAQKGEVAFVERANQAFDVLHANAEVIGQDVAELQAWHETNMKNHDERLAHAQTGEITLDDIFGAEDIGVMMRPESAPQGANRRQYHKEAWTKWVKKINLFYVRQKKNMPINNAVAAMKTALVKWLSLPFNKDTLLEMIDADIMIPLNVLMLRPHIRVSTESAIKLMDQGRTGKLYIHKNDIFSFDADAGTNMTRYHWRVRMKAKVTDDRKLAQVMDLFIEDYVSGGGIVPFKGGKAKYKATRKDNGNGSMFFVPLPQAEGYSGENAVPVEMSITGHWDDVEDEPYRTGNFKHGHYSSWGAMVEYWGWDKFINAIPLTRPTIRGGHRNVVCYRSVQRYKPAKSPTWVQEFRESGPLLKWYPGIVNKIRSRMESL